MDEDEIIIGDGPCPRCGGLVAFSFDCPGYGTAPNSVMVCWPPCGNAQRWDCLNDDCGWWYREPPGIRRDVQRIGERPAWLPAHDNGA